MVLTLREEVCILRSRPETSSTVLGRKSPAANWRCCRASCPARGGHAPTHHLMRVRPPRVLLENGTEESQKRVRASAAPLDPSGLEWSDRRYLSQASKTDNVRHGASWCQRSGTSDTNSLRSFRTALRDRAGTISMESLILAQDERWRRA